MSSGKIMITGTGRCGTTYLMQLLSVLGLPTGFTRDTIKDNMYGNSNGGLEGDLIEGGPEIVKNPQFWRYMPHYAKKFRVLHVYIPMRDLDSTARSRADRGHDAGGFCEGVSTLEEQIAYNARSFYTLVYELTKYEIQFTVMSFPRIVLDAEYCWKSLSWIMQRYFVGKEAFIGAHNQISDPNLIHY